MASTVIHTDLDRAFPAGSVSNRGPRVDLLVELHEHYLAYMSGPQDFQRVPELNASARIRDIEDRWLGWEDAQVDEASLPETADQFGPWFDRVASAHVQSDFNDYVATTASRNELALFVMAEELVDSKFDDLVSMVQIGAVGETKLTIAENYWDEMGNGDLSRVHTIMFDTSVQYMRNQLEESHISLDQLSCAEVYENACLLLMYGIHRRLNPRGLGAMGVLEHSASPRFAAMVEGCTRVGVPDDVVEYQRIHVHVDANHGQEWLEHVLLPLVSRSPALLREISLGVATRIRVADAYYQRVWSLMKGWAAA